MLTCQSAQPSSYGEIEKKFLLQVGMFFHAINIDGHEPHIKAATSLKGALRDDIIIIRELYW